ncbi:hypothetical protein, partial [Escherichia coli]|uniref:hypothetical protein n=1 Tax=Escherichia coli TaxID=562 RepID=UPI000AB43C05
GANALSRPPGELTLSSTAYDEGRTASNGGTPTSSVKKGEMLPIVVTIKDANGNPVGGEPHRLCSEKRL